MVVPLDGDGETEGDVLKDGVRHGSKMGSGMSIDLFVEPD